MSYQGQGYPPQGPGGPPDFVPVGQPVPPAEWDQTIPRLEPAPKTNIKRMIIVLSVVLVVVVAAIFAYFRVSSLLQPVPAPLPPYTPVPLPTPTSVPMPTPSPTPAPTPAPTPGPLPTLGPSQAPLGVYAREREDLTEVEQANFGYLHKGDCFDDAPGVVDDHQPVQTIDCSQPHTDQIMGFVDLSEGMPDISNLTDFEFAVARRCNSLRATLPIPEGFSDGVKANYPDASEWNQGVRAAMCWVPIFNTTWIGSAVDGTAVVI